MKKNFLLAILALVFMTSACSDAKDKKTKNDDDTEEIGKKKKTANDEGNTDTETTSGPGPDDVINMIFKAAKSGDYSSLSDISVAPDADGDANDICGIADATEEKQNEFKSYFAKGKVVGDSKVEGNEAKVNIKFGPDGDKEETMMLLKKGKKWYLSSF